MIVVMATVTAVIIETTTGMDLFLFAPWSGGVVTCRRRRRRRRVTPGSTFGEWDRRLWFVIDVVIVVVFLTQ